MKIFITVIMVLLAALACGFIPVTRSDSFKINAPFDNVYSQVASPKNWLNWQPELKAASKSNQIKIDSNKSGFQIATPSIAIDVQSKGLGNFALAQKLDNNVYNYIYVLTPQSTSNSTLVTVISKTSLFVYVKDLLSKDDEQSPIAGLKNYMEDTRLYYGFTIRKELTTEKLIAVKKSSAAKSALYLQENKMLNELNRFISKNSLKITSPLQMQYVVEAKDSIQVMLGLPVDKKAATGDGIEYMTMPKGKILVGYFNDVYKNKEKLYNAMRKYMRDNYIRPMIQPIERFENNKLPAADTSRVNMELIVPYM